MNGFPLEPLSRVRSVRLRAAVARVAEVRAAFDAIVNERDEIAQRLVAARTHRVNYQAGWIREMAEGAHPVTWIKRHERYLELLDASIEEVQRAQAAAEQRVAAARAELDAALAEWRRVQAKCDALQSMRRDWQVEQRCEQERREEQAVEELRLARGVA